MPSRGFFRRTRATNNAKNARNARNAPARRWWPFGARKRPSRNAPTAPAPNANANVRAQLAACRRENAELRREVAELRREVTELNERLWVCATEYGYGPRRR